MGHEKEITLSCTAQPVGQIFFQCNDDWMTTEKHHETKEEFDNYHKISLTLGTYQNR